MAKFILVNMLKMDFSLVEKNKGETLFRKTVQFYGGQSHPNFVGGSYYTESKKEIELLLKHPWIGKVFVLDPDFADNKPYFGKKGKPADKEEVLEDETAEVEDDQEPEEQKEEEVIEHVEPLADENSLIQVEDITTVQQASIYVRKKDPSIKAVDVRTKSTILEVAAKLGISFPNL
jgi:uncharacterized membrane protein